MNAIPVEHAKDIARRLNKAEDDFIATLVRCGGISDAEAAKVLKVYRKAKVIKTYTWMGLINVKHGAFLDRDVIGRALASA